VINISTNINIMKATTYDLENQGPALDQSHKYGGIKPVSGIPTLPYVFKITLFMRKIF
jgi:hypothetical protein